MRKLFNFLLSRNSLPFDGYSEDFLHTIHVHEPSLNPDWTSVIADIDNVLLTPFDRRVTSRWRSSLYAQILIWSLRQNSSGEIVECGLELGQRLVTSLCFIERTSPELLSTVDSIVAYDSFEGWSANTLTQDEHVRNPPASRRFDSRINPDSLLEVYNRLLSPETVAKIKIIKGWLPDSLVNHRHINFLSLDLNYSLPEVETFRRLLPSLSGTSIVLLDDYSTSPKYESHWLQWNLVASNTKSHMISLPTGQAILLRPTLLSPDLPSL